MILITLKNSVEIFTYTPAGSHNSADAPQPEQLVDLLPQLGLQFNQALVADRMAFGCIRMDLAALQSPRPTRV